MNLEYNCGCVISLQVNSDGVVIASEVDFFCNEHEVLVCAECGKQYIREDSIADESGEFCSDDCEAEMYGRCDECGTRFELADRSGEDEDFCSGECEENFWQAEWESTNGEED